MHTAEGGAAGGVVGLLAMIVQSLAGEAPTHVTVKTKSRLKLADQSERNTYLLFSIYLKQYNEVAQ